MLIDKDNLVRYKGNVRIPTLEGEVDGYSEIAMAKKEGVVFISYFKKQAGLVLDKFIVGAMDESGKLVAQKEYTENNEKSFFEAVKYFEELVEQRQPPKDNNDPSLGKFYYFKKVLNMDSFVKIEGVQDIIIDKSDIDTLYSPPTSKSYAMLNLADTNNPNYFPIQGKYILKYLKNETVEYGQNNNLELKELYKITIDIYI